MAKDMAISKRLKISEAQQYILLSVFGASVFLGVAIALVLHFVDQIAFNADVITAQDQSIVSYSNLIETVGICERPKGDTYSSDELNKCQPDNIDLSKLSGTLRANILTGLASNEALNSVPKGTSNADCISTTTGRNYTYKELNDKYNDAIRAGNSNSIKSANELIKKCSALRVIPDALPAFKNEEALLASLNQLFLVSGWEPEALSPSGTTTISSLGTGLNAMSVNVSVEADSSTTMNVLNSIERSIREFNIERATIEWGGNNSLILRAQATAYYTDPATVTESIKTITGDKKK